MASVTKTCEVVISAPDLQKLVAVHLKVHGDLLEEEYLSYHHAVTTIARGLTVNNPDILACPGWREDDLFIIVSEEQWLEAGWRNGVGRITLEILEDRRMVSGDLLANCLWYTIMYRLSPEWNRIGNVFIQGSDFLSGPSSRCYRGLDVNVCVQRGRVLLKLSPYSTTMTHITTKDLGDGAFIAEGTSVQQGAPRRRGPIVSQPCFVLPKQSRSVILSARKTLPRNSIFENYAGVRKYWKSMYGYCLPEAEPEFYCEVKFFGPNNTVFTYPNYCLLGKKIELANATELERAHCIKAFLSELRVHMPTLCGVPTNPTCLPWAVSEENGDAFAAASTSLP